MIHGCFFEKLGLAPEVTCGPAMCNPQGKNMLSEELFRFITSG
jgi:hypothetical protein